MKHLKTPRGLTGFGGGRWSKIPQPPQWYSASSQLPEGCPFAAGTTRPNIGTSLGWDMHVGTAVCGDPQTWYQGGLISSPSLMLFGLNGNGKGTLGHRLMTHRYIGHTGSAAFHTTPLWLEGVLS